MAERTETSTTHRIREQVARAVLLICTVIAFVTVVAAIMVALRSSINEDNVLVELVTGVANVFDGPFSRENGIFSFDGKNRETYDALLNWGLSALVWVVIGRVGSSAIRP